MTKQIENDLYKQLRDMARQHKIQIMLPSAPKVYQNGISNDISMNNDNNDNTNSSIHDDSLSIKDFSGLPNVPNMSDLIVAIPDNTNVNNVNKGPSTFQILKDRYTSPLSKFIQNNDKEGLYHYLNKERTLSRSEISSYSNHFLNDCTYAITNNLLPYLEVMEKSNLFKICTLNNMDFWMNVAFKADNVDFLLQKLSIKEIVECTKLQNKIKITKPLKIVQYLLQINDFKMTMQDNFNLLNYIPKMIDESAITMLELVLDEISVKEKKINFEHAFINYSKTNVLSNDETDKYYFNQGLRSFIIHSDYEFTIEDTSLQYINKENQILINKKRLNKRLENKLPNKPAVKKLKI